MRRLLAHSAFVLGVLLAVPSAAQVSSGFRRPAAVTSQPPPSERPGSLEAHLALSVAERLLASDDSDDRVRGVDRLASSGLREAIDRLARALADGSSSLRDPRARLAAVRGLFPFGARESVRQALRKVLEGEVGPEPVLSLARDTAALALAASNDARSLEVLNAAIRQGGDVGDAAERALLAYPPASLAPLGVGREELPATVCELLGKLGDQRAIGSLRGTLVRGLVRGDSAAEVSTDVDASLEDQNRRAKFAAALALARLGDQEQVAVARSWLASSDDGYRLQGAEVLLVSGAPDARRALVPLLSAASTRAAAFELAALAPGAELLGVVGDAAKGSDDAARIALSLLGRLGGRTAVERLDALLRDPAHAWEAAFALARAPGDEARRVLDLALSNREGKGEGAPRVRLAARAGVVRALSMGDAPRALDDTLRSLFASKEPADRAAGAFGLAALGKMRPSELAASSDPVVVRAAARAALVLGTDAAVAFGRRLAAESDRTTRTALAIALARSTEAFEAVPTYDLLAWAESDEPIAPLAIVALGSREEPGEERRIGRWLESDDPVVRLHAALALSLSPLPNATGRLADAWRFEPESTVRRAIVASLAQRKEPARLVALQLAETLDPDAGVREAAALARSNRLPSPLGRTGQGCAGAVGGCYVAWIQLVPSAASSLETVRARAGSLVDASGLSLPVVSDPDGALVVPGVSSGDASFHLASSGVWYDALGHDRSQAGSAR